MVVLLIERVELRGASLFEQVIHDLAPLLRAPAAGRQPRCR